MRILLINQYSGNKGDRAVLYAMCRILKSIYRDVEITVSTSDPELWNGYKYYSSEGIRFVPWGWDYDRVKKYKFYWRFLNRFKKYTFTLLRESFMRNVSLARFLANPEFKKAYPFIGNDAQERVDEQWEMEVQRIKLREWAEQMNKKFHVVGGE